MAKLIHNISSTNDSEQYKDNNNITKYLESNKDRITDLTKKNYENLVEILTNNVINTAVVAASSSSNLSLSQPQSSSSTFSNSFDQIDNFRKEESENYHNNSKGD